MIRFDMQKLGLELPKSRCQLKALSEISVQVKMLLLNVWTCKNQVSNRPKATELEAIECYQKNIDFSYRNRTNSSNAEVTSLTCVLHHCQTNEDRQAIIRERFLDTPWIRRDPWESECKCLLVQVTSTIFTLVMRTQTLLENSLDWMFQCD